MKKQYILIFIFALLFALTGCGNNSIETPVNLVIDGRNISWTEVENATEYDVMINDEVFTTDDNSFVIPDKFMGSVIVKVKARSEKAESEYSEAETVNLQIILTTPTGLIYASGRIEWSAVDDATGYIVNINGTEFFTENNYYVYTVSDYAEVKVLAVGNTTGTIVSSPYTTVLILTMPLAAPTNISLADGVITWDEVDNATGYMLQIGSSQAVSVSSNTYNVGYNYVGNILVKIKAVNSDGEYSDSVNAEKNLTFPQLTLTIPGNLSIEGNQLSFDSVEHADGYEIYSKGVLLDIITTNSFTLPSSVMDDESAYIEVKAISDIHLDSGLSFKIFVSLTEISTEADLIAVETVGNYILTSDIVLTSNWIPKDFSGMFDGNGFSISGIMITTDSETVGFFASLDNATVTDLTLSGSITVTTESYQSRIGGLAGEVSYSNVSDVELDIDITANSLNGVGNLGGVFGNLQNSQIINITYNGEILAENYITGGFAGKAENPEISSMIEKVIISSQITLTGGEQSFLGGFIGYLINNMIQISESGVNVDLVGTSYVGGFIGYYGMGEIRDSYAVGTVEASNLEYAHVGGFIGRQEGYNAKITNCIAQVEITENGSGDFVYYGGFTGYALGGTFTDIHINCYYDASDIDRIGNPSLGRGDGIQSIMISEVTSIEDFSETIWDFTGETPSFNWE